MIVEVTPVLIVEEAVVLAIAVVGSSSDGAEESPGVEDVTAIDSEGLADDGLGKAVAELIDQSGEHVDSDGLGFDGGIEPSLCEVGGV